MSQPEQICVDISGGILTMTLARAAMNAFTPQMMWRMMGAPSPIDAPRLDSRLICSRGTSADAAEGVTSLLEKRVPIYTDSVFAHAPRFSPWLDDLVRRDE